MARIVMRSIDLLLKCNHRPSGTSWNSPGESPGNAQKRQGVNNCVEVAQTALHARDVLVSGGRDSGRCPAFEVQGTACQNTSRVILDKLCAGSQLGRRRESDRIDKGYSIPDI